MVLEDITFEAQESEFIGILGPNGAGKTTLLMALSGIVPAVSGSINVCGVDLVSMKPLERARKMAVVSQDGEVRFPFPCEDVVRMGRYPYQQRWRLENPEDGPIVRRAMNLTDTECLADRLITRVSGGERQRVVAARALAQEAPILLLDEATSAMDISRKIHIFRILDRLNRENTLTILAVLHDVNLAALFCRRLVFLKDGRIVADGTTESVLTREVLQAVYDTPVLVQEIPGTGKRQVAFLP
jgi:iron complex transport system ATP-binding protein